MSLMNKKFSFWAWWIGRLIPLSIPGLVTYLLFVPVAFEVDFLFSASRVSGKVQAYGVNTEVVGGMSIHGSWDKIRHTPWVEVLRNDNNDGIARSCRIEGQLGVFGDWLSDDEPTVRKALQEVVKSGYIEYYILPTEQIHWTQLFEPMCRVKKAVDIYAIGIFLILLLIDLAMLVFACRSFNYRKFRRDQKIR